VLVATIAQVGYEIVAEERRRNAEHERPIMNGSFAFRALCVCCTVGRLCQCGCCIKALCGCGRGGLVHVRGGVCGCVCVCADREIDIKYMKANQRVADNLNARLEHIIDGTFEHATLASRHTYSISSHVV